jgi:adenine deaminase
MEKMKTRERLSEVALGNEPPDTIISNGTVFNVFTGEFIPRQSIWIKDGKIAYVGPDHDPARTEQTQVIDADAMVLLPGLVEGHTHVTSNRSGVEEFIRHVIPSGVTTVVTETIELGTIAGKRGFEFLLRGLEGQPIRFYHTVAPLCGLTPATETNALTEEEFLPFLQDPRCLGVGEIYWANLFLEGNQGERLRRLSSIALDLGKRVEGHSAGATGRKLQAYACFGVSSCHEPITESEVLERLRLGYWVMIREGAVRKELEAVKGIFGKKVDLRRLALSTDGMDPEGFLKEGYLDASLKRALEFGAPPGLAYQMVTINVAEHFRLDHQLGSLSPGKMADLVVIPSPDRYSPQLVMCDGKVIFKDGKAVTEPRGIFFPEDLFETVKVSDYQMPQPPARGKVRAIELVTRLVTKERIIDLDDPGEPGDLAMIFALDRLGSGKGFMGYLQGFGLQKGACGSTMCWDTIDMIVVGCDRQSIRTVIERLREIGGGAAYAVGEEIVSEFRAPLCGVLSLEPMKTVRDEIKNLEEVLRRNGVRWEKPLLTIDTLGSPAIPHLKITHEGYVRLKDREILPVEV